MNIDKYIELLRFYVTDKINETNMLLKRTLVDEMDDVISSVLASVFSLFFSHEFLKINGFWGAVLSIIVVVALYFLLKQIIKQVRRYFKDRNYSKKINDNSLDFEEAMSYVSKFDHIACDGILVSRDFLQRYDNQNGKESSANEKLFYLIEAFYYYNKALNVSHSIVKYSNDCINSPKRTNAISYYRLINVYKSLEEIESKIQKYVDTSDFDRKKDFLGELKASHEQLDNIKSFIDNIEKEG